MQASNTFQSLKRVDFKKGDLLFKEGDQGFFFYIIQEGKVEIIKHDAVLAVIEPGQPVGEFALLTESLRSASARALTDGFAIEISEEGYKQLLSELPSWAIAIMQSLVRRLKEANEKLSQIPDEAKPIEQINALNLKIGI